MDKNDYRHRLDDKLRNRENNVYLKYLDSNYANADLMSKICIHIPDYCDPETIPTMMSCVKAAVNSDRIYFAVCYQGDDMDELEKIKSFKNCKVKYFSKKDAPGTCAARYACVELTDNDMDFVLHIDSHMRFAEFWDVAIIQQWHDCNDENAILSAYALNYAKTIDDDVVSDSRLPENYNGRYMNVIYFTDTGKPRFRTNYQFDNSWLPRRSPFIGAHCTFLPLHIDKEIPTDPNMHFLGDEFSMSVRYWTHGYDVYQFGINFIYHLYARDEVLLKKNNVEIDRYDPNHSVIVARRNRETARARKLLRINNDPSIDLTGFDIGSVRSIRDYETFAGINFKNKIVTKFAYSGAYDEIHSSDDLCHVDYSDKAKEFNSKYGDCEKYKNMTIAVMLYAIGGNVVELIDALSATAAYPDRLCFHVACTNQDDKIVDGLRNRGNVIIENISEYKGMQYGYYRLGKSYRGEDYVMYLSTIAKPVDNWDIYYVNMMHKFGAEAVISETLCRGSLQDKSVFVTGVSDVSNYGVKTCVNRRSDCRYKQGAFVKFDFMFMSGQTVMSCPFDPYLTDTDAQFSYSVRLWTYGHDLYNLDEAYFHADHDFLVRLPSVDLKRSAEFHKTSMQRVRFLYDVRMSKDLDVFGCGSNRTILSFEDYAGISVKDHKLSINAIFGNFGVTQNVSLSKLFSLTSLRNALSQKGVSSVDDFFSVCSYADSFIDSIDLKSDDGLKEDDYLFGLVDAFLFFSIEQRDDLCDKFASYRMPFYTIEDALRIMFKGKKLRDALIVCKDILSKKIVRIGDTVEDSFGGIYFNVDDRVESFGDKKPLLAISSSNMKDVTTIRSGNVGFVWRLLSSRILQKSNAKTVLITGSDGKTTTKCIVSEVLKLDCGSNERFVCSTENNNGLTPFCRDVGSDFSDVKYYVKEFGVGGKTTILTEFSKQFNPDVSVIVNIGGSCHFGRGFKDRYDVFDTKVRVADGLKDDGVLLINKDDDILKSAEYSCNVITFAINDLTADYFCKDVIEENDFMIFTIVCPDREIKNVRMNVHGRHNIYGALIATAIADRFCISDDKIISGLLNFKYDGTRQTVYKAYRNNTVIFDCFGCSVESDVTMLNSLMSIKVPNGARHIAFLGHMATTGIHSDELHRKLAKIIASDFNLDLLVCYGGKSKYFCDEYIKAGKNAVFFNDDIEAMCYLREELRDGDAILVKGCGSYKFGTLFKNNIENNALTKPLYLGKYADDNDFHGVSNSMLCRNIDTDALYVDKCASVKRLAHHVSIIFVIVALCDMYKDKMDQQMRMTHTMNDFLTKKYYVGSTVLNKSVVTLFSRKDDMYSVKELLRIALDYTSLDIVYFLIEQVGRDAFAKYFDEFIKKLGCVDTVISDPQSYDIKKNCTTADDIYRVLKYFVKSFVFESIMSIDSDALVASSLHSQKSKLLRYVDDDEEDTYCSNILFAKKMYDLKSSSCVAVAKISGEYVACVALDRAIVYKNHAPDVDVSRMAKRCVSIIAADKS